MKSLLVLSCCVALATSGVAAEGPHKAKKKKGVDASAQLVAPTGGKANKKFKAQQTVAGGAQFKKFKAQGGPQIQKLHTQHFKLKSGPSSGIASVSFNAGYRIKGASSWSGPNYVVFRSYQPVWHDRAWWQANHTRIVLIGGGWYYWNAGFWYPAWGYDSAFAYYPYDGPIYAYNDLPPDQVVANVQTALQAQGYYRGEVDGLLGPLTRAAVARYQSDHGLYVTSAIDRPTMESLGFV